MDRFGLDRPVQSVLFFCNHNSIRSPIAAALLSWRSGGRLYVQSCGMQAGQPDPFAVAVMDELGLALDLHTPRTFLELEDASFDVVVTLTPQTHHFALERSRTEDAAVMYWPTFDPTLATGSRDQRLEEYRRVRDDIDSNIRTTFSEWVTPV